MTTVNSLSGGKTSSYLAVHYPSDYELFALVCNDDPKCAHPDPKIMQMANDKLSKYSAQYGEFIGTPENYKTLNVMFDLEQMIGREIIWLRGKSFDQLIEYKKALPNQQSRWCTTLTKLDPIFQFCYLYTELPVQMRVGFRYDEKERADKFSTSYKYPYSCNNYGLGRQNWTEVEWRVGDFVLIVNRIVHYTVAKFWEDKNLPFPEDSNCQMCFWKHPQQLKKNFNDAPFIMQWAKAKEKETGKRFHFDMSMKDIEKIGLQLDFFFGTGTGCSSGFCTD